MSSPPANLNKDYEFPYPPRRLEVLQGQEHRGQGDSSERKGSAFGRGGPAPPRPKSASVASAEEFAATASKTTVVLTNLLQGLLVACVVLWVMDVPRQVFNLSFYTEQLLTACLGLTLALAFVVESRREYRAIDPAGAIAVIIILIYIAYRFPNPLDIPPLLWIGLAAALAWTFMASRPNSSRAPSIMPAPPCRSSCAATSSCATSR